ncbi:MAG: outer membrane lipoprotein SlyB [Motiliproteus sp.]|jgi:outer membrane lipoprotein SlyB
MKIKRSLPLIGLLVGLTLGLTGCLGNPTNMDARTLHASEAQRAVAIQRGVILTAEEVQVQAEGTPGASLVGTIIGLGLGSEVGAGTGRSWAMGAGALLGGMLGEKATQYNQKAFAYIVELQNGKSIQIVQQGVLISPNTPVFVKYFNGGRGVLQVDSSQGGVYNRTRETQYVD